MQMMPLQAIQPAQLPLPGVAFGISMTNADAEMEIVRRITPEHISQEIANSHTRTMRQLDLQERSIENEVRECEREHERDQRDRNEQEASDRRIERVFYVIVASAAVLAIALVFKDKAELAVKIGGTLGAAVVALLGGMGVERLRQDRLSRRKKRKDQDRSS
jgi:hypothetical protein